MTSHIDSDTGTDTGMTPTVTLQALAAAGDQPGWRVLDTARTQQFTGEITFPTQPSISVYFDSGVAYHAVRAGDPSLCASLIDAGVVEPAQVERGVVRVGNVENLGRLFDRDLSIDRDAVMVVLELATDDVVTDIANTVSGPFTLTAYRHHVSGVHRWFVSPEVSGEQPAQLMPVGEVAQIDGSVTDDLPGLAAAALVDDLVQIEWNQPIPNEPEAVLPIHVIDDDLLSRLVGAIDEPASLGTPAVAPAPIEDLPSPIVALTAPIADPPPVADLAPTVDPAPAPVAGFAPTVDPAPAPVAGFAPAPVAGFAPAPVAEFAPAPVAEFAPAPVPVAALVPVVEVVPIVALVAPVVEPDPIIDPAPAGGSPPPAADQHHDVVAPAEDSPAADATVGDDFQILWPDGSEQHLTDSDISSTNEPVEQPVAVDEADEQHGSDSAAPTTAAFVAEPKTLSLTSIEDLALAAAADDLALAAAADDLSVDFPVAREPEPVEAPSSLSFDMPSLAFTADNVPDEQQPEEVVDAVRRALDAIEAISTGPTQLPSVSVGSIPAFQPTKPLEFGVVDPLAHETSGATIATPITMDHLGGEAPVETVLPPNESQAADSTSTAAPVPEADTTAPAPPASMGVFAAPTINDTAEAVYARAAAVVQPLAGPAAAGVASVVFVDEAPDESDDRSGALKRLIGSLRRK